MPSVRFIDPSFTRCNPSTNGLVDVAGRLSDRGWEVEVFSHILEPGLAGKVIHRKAPRLILPFGLAAWLYFLYYHVYGLFAWVRGDARADVTVSTGFMYLPADLATVHFSHVDYFRAIRLHGRKVRGLIPNVLVALPGLMSECLFLWNPWRTRLLAVSEAVAGDLRRFAAPWKHIALLPNQACTDKFCPAYRIATRKQARLFHGFEENQTVLLFASTGHYFRKGFLQAVASVARLRERGLAVRLLVVGGREKTIRRIRKILQRDHPDSADWMVITGMVGNPEFHYSAADALFFPSLSEAFSLVEIEAAALGLPLYLTAHHGSEMILRDRENGRLLPWDSSRMTDVMEEEIRGYKIRFTNGSTGRALSQDAYYEAWREQLLQSCQSPIGTDMPDMPKLLLIGHTYMIRVNREKARYLAEHFKVRVCTCDSAGWKVLGREVSDTDSPSHDESYELRRLLRWPRWQDYTKLVFRGLCREVADFRPDVILVENEPWSWLRWQARWAAWRAAPQARFAEFTWENVERPGIKGCLLRWIYRAAAATGDLVICGNQEARRLCIAAGFAEQNSAVAPQLGINPEDHAPASSDERERWRVGLGWDARAKVIGYCGRLVEEKGLVELVEAAGSLRAKHMDLHVVIVGEGSLRSRLESMDPHGEWLKILPAVRHEGVPDFLNKLDIFILPSKPLKDKSGQVWEEQFGHVLIEAMACGTLTLGSNSGAIPEVLDDPSVTFMHGDVGSLAAMMDYWLGDEQACQAKAEEQRARCARHWTHAAVAGKYASILSRAKAPQGRKDP